MYIYAPPKGNTVFPYSLSQLKKDNPNTSFPRQITDDLLARYDVFPVVSKTPPVISSTQEAKRKAQPVKEGDTWTLDWEVKEKDPNQIRQKLMSEVSKKVSELLSGCSSQQEWTDIMTWAWALRTNIKAAKSLADIASITVAGWPEQGK